MLRGMESQLTPASLVRIIKELFENPSIPVAMVDAGAVVSIFVKKIMLIKPHQAPLGRQEKWQCHQQDDHTDSK